MAYKPPRVGRGGPKGIATVSLGKMNGKKAVRVDYDDDKAYTVLASNCPDYVQEGKFFVVMSAQKDEIQRMSPVNGQFTGKVSQFMAQEGKPPVPKTRSYQNKDWKPYQYFAVFVEVTDPERYKGMEVYIELRYHFGEAQEEINGTMRRVAAITNLRSPNTGTLEEFLDATGVWEHGPIKYSDNILPILQKRILTNDREFGLILKDGWLQYFIIPDENTLEVNDDWGDDSEGFDADDTPLEVEDSGSGWGEPDEEEVGDDDTPPWDDVDDNFEDE